MASDMSGVAADEQLPPAGRSAGPGGADLVSAGEGGGATGRDRRRRPTTDLHVEVVRRGAEIRIAGRLDGRNAPVARAVLHSTIDDGHGDVVLHLGRLDIWDASGLGVVVGAHRRAQQAGRRLVLTDVPLRQLRQLRATRLHRVLTVEPFAIA